MNKIANKFRWLVWFMCGLCTACTVYDTPADIAGGSSEVSQKDDGVVRYVLWVNIDGARGTVVKEEVEKGNLPVLNRCWHIANMLGSALRTGMIGCLITGEAFRKKIL